MNHDPKIGDANFLQKLNPVFSMNPSQFHSQYSKNLNTLHESLNRVQATIDEHQQNMRVKNLYSLTNETLAKSHGEIPSFKTPPSVTTNNSNANDKNNNKNAGSFKENKNENSHFENSSVNSATVAAATTATEKSGHIIHLNSKTGVSLKCAYCEAREDFKTR